MFKPNRKFLILIAFAIAFCSLLHLQLKAQGNQVVSAGSSTATVSFPKTTCTYNWTNSNPAIGLAASGSGDIASFTATNTTGSPITATIIATPSGTRNQPLLYIPNYDDNTVSVIDASTNAIITTLSLGSNTHPYNVTVSRDYNRVFVSNQGTNTVSVIYMPTDNGQYATITGFSNPGAIAIGPGNVTGYVANTGSNTVSIIENINYTINGSITVGNAPVGLALTNDGSILYVSNSADNTISVVNTTTHVVLATIPVDPGGANMVLSPFNTTNEDKLYVVNAASNEITVISTATNTIINRFSVGSAPKGLTVSPDGSRLYVSSPAAGNVTVFDTSNGSVIKTINLGSTPTGLSISDDGSLLYVTNAGSNNVKVINTNSFAVTQTIAVGTNPYSVGNFYLSRADCAGPISFTITVNAASVTPTITTNGTPTALNTTVGTASAPSTFTTSGTNLTGNIVITAPTGFEVSLDNITYYNVVTKNGPGNVGPQTVYIRLKNTDAVGSYSGNISLTSPGAPIVSVSIPSSTVTAAPISLPNQIVAAGSKTTAVSFPSANCIYQWTNDNPSIGLPASGFGDIPSFTALNNDNSNIVAHITANTVAQRTLYVPISTLNQVAVVNVLSGYDGNVFAHISVGSNPTAALASLDGSKVFVTNSQSQSISVINSVNNTVGATINLSDNPSAMVLSPDGTLLYVISNSANCVYIINIAANAITSTINSVTGPKALAVSPDGGKLYVSGAQMYVINTGNNSIITRLTQPGNVATALLLSSDGTQLYGSEPTNNFISVFNTATNTYATNMPAPLGVSDMTIFPNSTNMYVSNQANNMMEGITIPSGLLNRPQPSDASPGSIAITSNGNYLFVSNFGSNTITTYNSGTHFQTGTIVVGQGPGSIGHIINPGGSCSPAQLTFTITVTPGPSLSATNTLSSVSTVYGTASSSSSFTISGANLTGPVTVTAPAGFEVSTDNTNFSSSVTIPAASVGANKTIYVRLTTTASAGNHTGTINISSSGAADLNVTMPLSTVTPKPINILVRGTKVYGTSIPTNFTAGPADVDFSPTNQQLVNGELINSIDITFTAGYNATDPAATYSLAIHIANAQGTNGFLPSNYTITYQSGDLVVNPAPLTITAADVNKPNGTTLSGGPITTGYAAGSLQNNETLTGVTVTYGNGSAANAAPGTYPGSVVLSNATGTSGFLASNYTITYVPAKIIVGVAGPAITASGNLTPLTTVYGTPSTAETFTVSGTNMTAGILITPPAGFEVSTDDATFTPTVAVGVGGNVTNQTVFIRLKSTANAGTYGGNIVMSSNGASNVNLAMPTSTVTPAPLTITASNTNKTYGQTYTTATGFTNFTPNGLKNSETIGSVSVTYGTGGQASSNTGVYSASVTVSQPVGTGTFLAGNYNITYMAGSLTVIPAALTITANNQTRQYGAPNPTLTFSYSGFVNGEDTTVLTTKPAAATPATLSSSPGQFPITLSGGAAKNYTFNYVQGTLTVTAIPGLPVSIPNAFTPNGDGINDIWNIANLNTYAQSRVKIFNRYGILVFNSVGYATPWDGTEKNTRVPDGTYYYLITLTPGDSPLSGSVAVIR